jgi:hypothetical protein
VSSQSAIPAARPVVVAEPIVDVNLKVVGALALTALLALIAYYFIGVDEGMSSVFGKSMMVHEFFHDGRHFLGFPCH